MTTLPSNEKNYDMQTLMNLVGRSAENVTALSQSVIGISKKVDDLQGSVKGMRTDIDYLKNTSEINYSQQVQIRNAAHRRVYEILNIPRRKEDRTLEDKVVIQKYAQIFFSRLYSEVPKLGHLGNSYRTTQKQNYDAAIMDIEAWVPNEGISALKHEADENREAKRIAENS